MNEIVKKDDALPPKTGALASGGSVRAVVPQTLDDVYRLANIIVASGLAPKDFKTKEACTIAILHGMEIGLKPLQSLQRIAVINNRPTLWGDAMLGLVDASGLLEDIAESFQGKPGEDGYMAVCEIKRRGRPTKTVGTFSIANAKAAQLLGKTGPWTQYRDRMLKMRARSFALRDAFPDVLGGMYSAEEAMDMGPGEMKDITPERPKLSDFTKAEGSETVNQTDSNTAAANEAPAPEQETAPLSADDLLGELEDKLAKNSSSMAELNEFWTQFEPDINQLPLEHRKILRGQYNDAAAKFGDKRLV